jgi:hypothetical protein
MDFYVLLLHRAWCVKDIDAPTSTPVLEMFTPDRKTGKALLFSHISLKSA